MGGVVRATGRCGRSPRPSVTRPTRCRRDRCHPGVPIRTRSDPEQDAVLRSHYGGQRYAVTWGLALVTAVLEQRQVEVSSGIPAELTPSLNWSAYSPRKRWNQAKTTTAPWWAANSKEAHSSGLANLATALGNRHASR